jgi:hypothetical protein
VTLNPLGTSATNWPIVPAQDDKWMWSSRWKENWQEKPKYSENTYPVPLCPPQIPHDLTWDWTLAAAVGSRRLTAWALSQPLPLPYSLMLHYRESYVARRSLSVSSYTTSQPRNPCSSTNTKNSFLKQLVNRDFITSRCGTPTTWYVSYCGQVSGMNCTTFMFSLNEPFSSPTVSCICLIPVCKQDISRNWMKRLLAYCINNSRLTALSFVSYGGRGFHSEKNLTAKTIERRP